MQETAAPYRRYVVRQITGAIARRIVCWLKPGDELARGEQFGMIKLGSRTELVLPREEGLEDPDEARRQGEGGADGPGRVRAARGPRPSEARPPPGKVFAVLPTLLTLGNAVCGFGAITFAAKWAGATTWPRPCSPPRA